MATGSKIFINRIFISSIVVPYAACLAICHGKEQEERQLLGTGGHEEDRETSLSRSCSSTVTSSSLGLSIEAPLSGMSSIVVYIVENGTVLTSSSPFSFSCQYKKGWGILIHFLSKGHLNAANHVKF